MIPQILLCHFSLSCLPLTQLFIVLRRQRAGPLARKGFSTADRPRSLRGTAASASRGPLHATSSLSPRVSLKGTTAVRSPKRLWPSMLGQKLALQELQKVLGFNSMRIPASLLLWLLLEPPKLPDLRRGACHLRLPAVHNRIGPRLAKGVANCRCGWTPM